MPLPHKLTPREDAELCPAALAAKASEVAKALRAVAKETHAHYAGEVVGNRGPSETASAASTRAAVASAEAGKVLPGGLFSKPGQSRSARETAARAHEDAAEVHATEGSHDWARYHQNQADEERRAGARATRKEGGAVGEADLTQGGKLVPDQTGVCVRCGTHSLAKDWDEESHPRESDGRFGAGGGNSAGPAKPGGGGAGNGKAELALWRAAGGASKVGQALRGAATRALAKIKGAPGTLKHAVAHQIETVKEAGAGIKAAASGKPMTPGQKAALRSVVLKVAVKVAMSAIGAALPGIGHAVGALLEHAAPHVLEGVAHFIAHHAVEHTIEHAAKHGLQARLGAQFKAATDDADWLMERVFAGLQDGLDGMTDEDWKRLLKDLGADEPAEKSCSGVDPTPVSEGKVDGVDVREYAPTGYGVAKADGAVVKEVDYQGIPVHVDRPAGFVQKGTGADGTPWERTYKLDYGFIPGTQGGDGEGLDVFLGPKANAPDAHWAVQQKADGQFDEYKVLFGFENPEDARKAYEEHIPPQYLKTMKSTSVQMVRALLGLEPVEVMKALLADSMENLLSVAVDGLEPVAKRFLPATAVLVHPVAKASVVVHEHERRAPLSAEEPVRAPKGTGSSGRSASASGKGHLSLLREASSVRDAGSMLHAAGNVVEAALRAAAGRASACARARSAEAGKQEAPAGPSERDKAVEQARDVAVAHAKAAAEHAVAEKAHELAGDQAGAQTARAAADGHASAAQRMADALDRLHADADDEGAWGDLKSAHADGEAHAAKVLSEKAPAEPAKSEGAAPKSSGSGGPERAPDGKFTAKASDEQLSRDSMTRPYVPVTPAAELDGVTKSARVDIVQKVDAAEPEERYVLGVVLIPEQVDSQGDIYSAPEIRKTAHRWMKDYLNIDLQHKVLINGLAAPVESYLAPADMDVGGRAVKAGTWLLAAYISDDDIWAQVKSGALTGWSISGLAKRVPVAQAA